MWITLELSVCCINNYTMSKFIKSLSDAKETYLPEQKSVTRRTTNCIFNEIFGAIDKFAQGAKKFNDAADGSPLQAVKGAAKGVQDWATGIGKTSGDKRFEQSIKAAWENMTSAQQAHYNQPNQYFAQLAQTNPKWAPYGKAKGFKRYQLEQKFKSDPANKNYLTAAGLQPSYNGQPSPTDTGAWDQWAQAKWQKMTPEQQQRYKDFANFDQIKRSEAQQGA